VRQFIGLALQACDLWGNKEHTAIIGLRGKELLQLLSHGCPFEGVGYDGASWNS
jgi:hypothetical protein